MGLSSSNIKETHTFSQNKAILIFPGIDLSSSKIKSILYSLKRKLILYFRKQNLAL